MTRALLLAAAFVLGHAMPCPVHAQPSAAAASEVRMNRISVIEMGEGDPVILIPGLASPRAVWDDIAPALARTHRVLLVQVNGFGGDDPGGNLEPGILDGIVADLAAHVEGRGLVRPAMIGHSMGGLAAMKFAIDHPDLVGRLMIVDALPFFAIQLAPPGGDISVAEVEPAARLMRTNVAATYGRPPDPAAAEAGLRGMALRPESRERMLVWALAADARVTAQALFENMTTDLRPALASIRAPITLVWPWHAQGLDRDRLDAFYRRQFANASDIRYVAIAEAAHFVMLDQPEAFADALHAFLAE